jgi:hypothetical protein
LAVINLSRFSLIAEDGLHYPSDIRCRGRMGFRLWIGDMIIKAAVLFIPGEILTAQLKEPFVNHSVVMDPDGSHMPMVRLVHPGLSDPGLPLGDEEGRVREDHPQRRISVILPRRRGWPPGLPAAPFFHRTHHNDCRGFDMASMEITTNPSLRHSRDGLAEVCLAGYFRPVISS